MRAMKVTRIRALRGPNLWSRHTAIEAVVACEGDENAISKLPGFEARLRARFPTIGELHPMVLGQPLALAHVLENAAVALQAQAGCAVNFGHTSPTVEEGVYQVTFQYSEEAVGRRASNWPKS
jgi:cyanophycin synthetase